jgi:hypothetical protein
MNFIKKNMDLGEMVEMVRRLVQARQPSIPSSSAKTESQGQMIKDF